jgi:hypothetical protein
MVVAVGAILAGCWLRKPGNEADEAPATPCVLCHSDVNDSFGQTKHASKGHTCATCHGSSAKHSWSEDGHVAPDRRLKARSEADALCIRCHKKHEHKTVDISTRSCSSCHKPHAKRQPPTEAETPPQG